MRISYDLHIHTYLSACCGAKEEQQPACIIDRAKGMGLTTLGFSDHIWVNPALEPSEWYRPQNETHIAQLRRDLTECSADGINVLVGCEAETIGVGRFGMTREFADTLDFVLLSCSHIHMKGFVAQPEEDTPDSIGRHLLSLFRSGVTSGLPTAIAHPLVPLGSTDRFDDIVASLDDAALFDAFGLAAERGVALEITTCFLPDSDAPQWRLETPVRMLTLAKNAGCRFTFGSDAHSAARQKSLINLMPLLDAADITDADMLLPPKPSARRFRQ